MIQQSTLTTNSGLAIPVYSLNTVILGAGAAGMNCAVHLYRFMRDKGVADPQDRIAVVTADRCGGASRRSGSDKQTYYKLGTSPSQADSAVDFARTLTEHGCAHGDIALVEALCSLREFHHLVELGVPFPYDPEGAYVGYKTDHDPRERATSAGPKTSKYMCDCLDREADRCGIRVFDGHEPVRLLTTGGGDSKRIAGILTLDRARLNKPGCGLTLFLSQNVVLAAGGPGELYGTSVYPEGQCGIHGLALEAGLKAHNLTESQFGLASTKFRWNVSGTYMQVVPRIYSATADGIVSLSKDEREFLAPYFDSTARMATNIFLKGYQWPFDPEKVINQGSSLIDVLVYYETEILGRRVFLDFRTNPIPGEGKEAFDLCAMGEEALTYLQRNGALQPTPIERLNHMNPAAIEVYLEHGIDLEREPLEIKVCAQHNNGGFVVDKWWQSNIPHTFVIGEMAGTHGVKRPGGSALNSGQVGGLRAAEYIANVYGCGVAAEDCPEDVLAQIESAYDWLVGTLKLSSGVTASEMVEQIQRNMSAFGAHIRRADLCKDASRKAKSLYNAALQQGIRTADAAELPRAVRARHLALTQVAFLDAIVEYLEASGGSRGSFLVLADDGRVIHPSLLDAETGKPVAFVPENQELRRSIAEVQLRSAEAANFDIRRVPVRPIPERDEAFETAWRAFRTGEVFRK